MKQNHITNVILQWDSINIAKSNHLLFFLVALFDEDENFTGRDHMVRNILFSYHLHKQKYLQDLLLYRAQQEHTCEILYSSAVQFKRESLAKLYDYAEKGQVETLAFRARVLLGITEQQEEQQGTVNSRTFVLVGQNSRRDSSHFINHSLGEQCFAHPVQCRDHTWNSNNTMTKSWEVREIRSVWPDGRGNTCKKATLPKKHVVMSSANRLDENSPNKS